METSILTVLRRPAAGARIWMVFSKLIPDANRSASSGTVGIVVTLPFAAMLAFQYLVLKG